MNRTERATATRTAPPGPLISFLVPSFNEEARIASVLAQALCWADEVIVVNKSSTDRTEEIARAYNSRVRVLTIPFTPQGQEQADVWVEHATHDWIFIGTCSEVPTRQLIEKMRLVLGSRGDDLDLVMVPRRMYSLGSHHPTSPWNVAYYPFLIHRHRAVITNVIHEHFKAADPTRIATIPYSEECCVHHLTHPSARRFIEVHAEYARVEAAVERDPALAIIGWLKNLHHGLPGIMRTGNDWAGIFSCWALYNLMNVLLTWEKARGLDVPAHYQQLRNRLLAEEWGVADGTPQALSIPQPTIGVKAPPSPPLSAAICPELKKTVFLAYWTANLLYHARHPGAIPRSLRSWAAGQKARMLRKLRACQ
jgi:hypothetical protein